MYLNRLPGRALHEMMLFFLSGFSELDSLGNGVVDIAVLLSAMDRNGINASLGEKAAILRRFDPMGSGVVGVVAFLDHFR